MTMFSTLTNLEELITEPETDIRGLNETQLYQRESEFQNYYAELEKKQEDASMIQEGLGHLRFNTSAYSLIERGVDTLSATPDLDFDLDSALSEQKLDKTKMEKWEQDILDTAVSTDHLMVLQEKIEDRRKWRENSENLGGVKTTIADMAFEVLNPIWYVPFLGKAAAVTRLGKAAVIGANVGAIAATDVAGRKLTYSDTTLTDVIVAGVAGATLGGTMNYFIKPSLLNDARQGLNDQLRNLGDDLAAEGMAAKTHVEAGSVGAAGLDIQTELAREGIDIMAMEGKVVAQFRNAETDPHLYEAFNKMIDNEIPQQKGIRPEVLVGVAESIQRSDNPMARYIGSKVLEHAEGSGGKFKSEMTADMLSDVYFAKLSGDYVSKYTKNFARFKEAIKGTGVKPQEFGDMVYKDINAQQLLLTETPYNMLTKVQQAVRDQANAVIGTTKKYTDLCKTKGVTEMADFSPNRFHLTRQYDAKAFVKLANLHGKDSVIELIKRAVLTGEHFLKYHTEVADPNLPPMDINLTAENIARSIFKRMSNRSVHSGMDANLLNTSNKTLLLDALADANVEAAHMFRIKSMLETAGKDRFADPTKGQISMNMSAEYNGLKMTDLLNTDLASGYMGELKHWVGRAALAEKGFPDRGVYDNALVSMQEIGKSRAGTAGSTPKGIDRVQSDYKKLDAAWKLIIGVPLESDINTPVYKIARGLRKLSAVSKLGKLGFAQTTETARLVTSVGVHQTLKGIPFLRKMRRNAVSGRMEDTVLRDLEDAGMGRIGDEYMLRHPDFRVDDLHENAFKGEKYIDKANYLLGHASGFNAVSAIQKRFYARQYAMRLHRDITQDKLPKAVANDIGWSGKDVLAFKNLMQTHAEPIKGFGSRDVYNLHVARWTMEYREKFIYGLHKQSNRAILKQTVGDLPVWSQTALGKFFTQFRTFSMVSGGKHGVHDWKMLKSGQKEGLNTFLLTTAMAIGMYTAKTQIDSLALPPNKRKKYLKNRLSDRSMERAALTWTGQLGVGAEALDYLGFGLLGWGGDDNDIHFNRSTDFSDALSSVPGIGYASDVARSGISAFKALGSDYKIKQSDARAFMSTIPFNNVMGITNLRNIALEKFDQ